MGQELEAARIDSPLMVGIGLLKCEGEEVARCERNLFTERRKGIGW